MTDRLLMTRREQLRETALKLLACGTVRAAVIGGLLLAVGLVAMLVFFAYVRSA